jgi:beta-lactam-binding protein with PASTA domain
LAPPDVGFGIPGLFVPQPGGGGPAPLVTPTQAPVPDVTALGYHMAKAKLAARELTAKVTGHRYSSWVRRGHVIAQFPRKSTLAQLTGAEKPIVKLVLSRGKRPHKQR